MNRHLTLLGCLIAALCGRALRQDNSAKRQEMFGELSEASRFAPIKAPKHVPAAEEFARQCSSWVQRVWVQPFEIRCKGAAWEAEAKAFVDEALRYWLKPCRITALNSATPELSAKARKLVDSGCDDPLVLYLAGEVHRFVEAHKQLRDDYHLRALAQVTKLGPETARSLAWFITMAVRQTREDTDQKLDDLDKQLIEWTRALLRDGTYGIGDAAVFVRHQSEKDSSPFVKKNASTLLPMYRESELPEWARETLTGVCEIFIGWNIRGDGTYDTVSQNARKAFAEHIALARTALEKACDLNPNDPVAPGALITVTKADNTGEERFWFDLAIAADPEYDAAYLNIIDAYQPKWGGSRAEMLAFGRACLATERYETAIPQNYIRICNFIAKDLFYWRSFFRSPEVARPLIYLSQKLVDARPEEHAERLSFLAVNAWIAGDFSLAANSLEKLNGPLHPDAQEKLGRFDSNESDFRAEVAILGGPAREEFEKGDECADRGEWAAARIAYENALPLCPAHARPVIEGRLSVLDVEAGLKSGQWIALETKPQLGAWMVRQGRWRGSDEGILMEGDGSRGLLVHRARIGPNFELRGTFSITDPERNGQRFNAAWGWWYDKREHYFSAGLYQKKGTNNQTVSINDEDYGANEKGVAVFTKPVNQFVLRIEDGKITYELNGKRIFDKLETKKVKSGPENGRVGLSGFYAKGTTTRISNLEIRKLNP